LKENFWSKRNPTPFIFIAIFFFHCLPCHWQCHFSSSLFLLNYIPPHIFILTSYSLLNTFGLPKIKEEMKPLTILILLAFIHLSQSLWVAQRYDYPKVSVMEVAKFGLERGGSYEIEVSFRLLVNIPISLLHEHSVRNLHLSHILFHPFHAFSHGNFQSNPLPMKKNVCFGFGEIEHLFPTILSRNFERNCINMI
jgi:hypothetical protein